MDKKLLELARAKWRGSGINDQQAKQLNYTPLDKDQMADLGYLRAAGLKLPYFDVNGKQTKFYRVRYLEELPGFAGAAEKPQRYAQPKGSLNEVYFPPLLDWRAVLKNKDTPIYITEGELKAASGCSVGLATLGLGGVDVWRSTKRGLELLPGLQAIDWENREVVIVYDSDATTNENVLRAQRQLGQALVNRGALPQIASIPARRDGGKQGLDDYLVAEGVEALTALLSKSPLFPEAQALWELNEEVLYARDPGLIVVRNTGQRLSPAAFTQHAYAHRHYFEINTAKQGPVSVRKPLAPRWLSWERRAEVPRITYAPGKAQLTDKGEWNVWPGWGITPKRGDLSPWKWLLDFIFKNEDEETKRWFERWCAYPLQFPGTKLFTSTVLWGIKHGTGKTLVAYTLMKIYGKNSVEIKDQDLRGSFNEWAENRQFVYGDEVTGNDKRNEADRLKGMITQETLRINAKYIPAYTVPDCVNYLFTSNHPDAFFLEDNDRRFFIHEVAGEPASAEEYAKYDKWLKGDGPAALFHHLLNLELGDFNPKAPARVTYAKKSMIVDNKSDLGVWCMQLKEDPTNVLRPLGERVAREAELLSPSQLFRAYDPENTTRVTTNGLGRELKRSGFRQVNEGNPIRTKAGLQRIYCVRNAEKWEKATTQEMVAHWEEVFGLRPAKF